ncbi:TPA: SDR family NAD(P)-dependent oxidoreductase, partial [Acinetobacter baumannii]|nr:SDR family NAD(P)-dependent oxidoreductase [Acinetobacter baumannii]
MKKITKQNILITGASSGVGKMLVKELKSVFNIVTISRRVENIIKDNPEVMAYSC